MKFYKILVKAPDPENQKAWDRYSQNLYDKPTGVGATKRIIVTNRKPEDGEICLGRWTPPRHNLQINY